MNTSILSDVLQSPATAHLARMLLHSIWQGTAAAGILAVALLTINRQHSAVATKLRYVLCCGAMLCVVIAAVATFAGAAELPIRQDSKLTPDPFTVANSHALTVYSASSTAKPSFDYRQYMPILVMIWAAGVLLQAVWQCVGFVRIQRLRQSREIVDSRWIGALHRAALQLGIHRAVRLVCSTKIDVPAAFGILRPVIVVPLAVLNDLSIQQAEAIIAHELAHVWRFDYAVNLIQTTVETIFFYHPAVWWISAEIRRQRENCCDDIAANLCGRTNFAGALIALEQGLSPRLAQAATGGSLLNRVRRLLNTPADTISRPKSVIISLIAIICIAGPACWEKLSSARADNAPSTQPASTRPDPSSTYSYIRITVSKGNSNSLTVNGAAGSWDTVRHEIENLPVSERARTVMVLSAKTDDVPVGVYFNACRSASSLVEGYHLAYLSMADTPTARLAAERIYYLGGSVKRPGVYSLAWPVTIEQALVAAGGADRGDFSSGSVTLIRRVNGSRLRVLDHVPFQSIISGNSPDPDLQPDDLVLLGMPTATRPN